MQAGPTAPALGEQTVLRLGARPLEAGFGCGWRLSPSSSRTFAPVNCTIPATAPSPRAHLRSLPVPASSIHSQKSSHQVRVLNLSCIAPDNSHLFATPTLNSANTALTSSTCAAFWFRIQQQQFTYVGASQTLGGGCPAAASSCAAAALWAPSMNERDIISEAWRCYQIDDAARPGPSDPDSANGAAFRGGTSYPSEIVAAVTVTKHCGVRVPRNNQPSTSPKHHHDTSHHNFKFSQLLSRRTFRPSSSVQHGSTPGQAHRWLGVTAALPQVRSSHEIPG